MVDSKPTKQPDLQREPLDTWGTSVLNIKNVQLKTSGTMYYSRVVYKRRNLTHRHIVPCTGYSCRHVVCRILLYLLLVRSLGHSVATKSSPLLQIKLRTSCSFSIHLFWVDPSLLIGSRSSNLYCLSNRKISTSIRPYWSHILRSSSYRPLLRPLYPSLI